MTPIIVVSLSCQIRFVINFIIPSKMFSKHILNLFSAYTFWSPNDMNNLGFICWSKKLFHFLLLIVSQLFIEIIVWHAIQKY